jgi:hypothetical protein
MDQFTSSDSYGLFRREVTRRSRYVLSLDAREFLRVVAATCKDRLFPVSTTEIFWRAQRGFCTEEREQDSVVYEESVSYGRKRMKPRAEKAREGRANAKGIPCLYVSTTKETAMSEVRPWVGALVSVAQFQVARPMTIVDCSRLHGQYLNLAFLSRTFDGLTGTMSPLDPGCVKTRCWI